MADTLAPLKNLAETDEKKTMKETNGDDSGLASDSDETVSETTEKEEELPNDDYKTDIVWRNVVKFIILHSLALYGLTFLPHLSWKSWLFLYLSYLYAGLGITAGAHRLWAHKSYKARAPLRLFLTVANCMAGENSIYTWTRDHRVHHKTSETKADPHNINRGFFFAHMGWLLVRKHPAVAAAGRTIDMSDLEKDPLVMFQHRHYIPSFILFAFVVPTLVPHYFWGESLLAAYFIAVVRYVGVLHFTWLVNSAAHMFGGKPYDVNIGPAENMGVSLLAMGEGFHNYHHVFPYDYRTSEWGFRINVTTIFLDVMAAVGMVYDRRTAKVETVVARAARTGEVGKTRAGILEQKKMM